MWNAMCPGVWPDASSASIPSATSAPSLMNVVFSASGTTFAWTSVATRSVGPDRRSFGLQKSYSAAAVT